MVLGLCRFWLSTFSAFLHKLNYKLKEKKKKAVFILSSGTSNKNVQSPTVLSMSATHVQHSKLMYSLLTNVSLANCFSPVPGGLKVTSTDVR